MMNKYQEVLDLIEGYTSPYEYKNGKLTGKVLESACKQQIIVLQELVNKSIPKKTRLHSNINIDLCTTCDNYLEFHYDFCPNCGQALEWNEEDD